MSYTAPMAEGAAGGSISTIVFTDIVDSTLLMQRLGNERAQRVFERHHRMLADRLAASGGEELQWLGDGQMAAFASPADAVRCAVAMQQGAVRPTIVSGPNSGSSPACPFLLSVPHDGTFAPAGFEIRHILHRASKGSEAPSRPAAPDPG